ncbi:OTU-like cysteine protease family protein [Aphelenchoides besseyi]|nr:OTU-like cysteine protease family protein [Aphelenchoides besseyi]
MSDDEVVSPADELKIRHSKEKKELLGCGLVYCYRAISAHVLALKKTVNKTDKKQKKEIQTTIANLEQEQKERHEKELRELTERLKETTVNKSSTVDEKSDEPNDEETIEEAPKKKNRAQKQREKKAEVERKRIEAAKEDAKNAQNSRGTLETKRINDLLAEQNLRLFHIEPNGDCMYNAVSQQLDLNSASHLVREKAAAFMLENRDDFLPFLEDGELDAEGFEEYCRKVRNSCRAGGIWGGATETANSRLTAAERTERVEKLLFQSENSRIREINWDSGAETSEAETLLHDDYSDSEQRADMAKLLAIPMRQIRGQRKLKQLVEQKRSTAYDNKNEEHEKMLQMLWSLLKPNEQLTARKTNQWQEIGFQGDDPSTDFRGHVFNLFGDYWAEKQPESVMYFNEVKNEFVGLLERYLKKNKADLSTTDISSLSVLKR